MPATELFHPLQFASINPTILTVAAIAFAMLCIYRLVTDNSFIGKAIGVALLIVAVYMLAGCSGGPVDPLGMTSRTQLRTDASVTIARSQSDAEIAKAQADEAARIAEAQSRASAAIAAEQAKIVTEQTRQNGMTARVMAWAGMIPWALLIVGAAVVVALVVNWQGRIWYERTVQAGPVPMLDATKLAMLQDYARQQNMRVIERDGEYLLTDGQRTIKALLKG